MNTQQMRLWLIRGYSPKSKAPVHIRVRASDYQAAAKRAKGFVVTDILLDEGK